MKKNLILVGTLAAPCLLAEDQHEAQPTVESCCLYPPQFYDLQCDVGVFIDVEFLYWYARETNINYAVSIVAQNRNVIPAVDPPVTDAYPDKYYELGSNWGPGARVGVGWNSCWDGWDFYLNWTYFKNSRKDSTKVAAEFLVFENLGETKLLNPWTSGIIENRLYNEISAKWRLYFNQIDLELGRKYWLSSCFTMRPYAGLRGAWTRTYLSLQSQAGPLTTSSSFSSIGETRNLDDFKNRIWGAGFLVGFQPNWAICHCLILYGDVDVSLLWGEHEGEASLDYFQSDSIVGIIRNTIGVSKQSCFLMSALLDLSIGLRWERTWCCDRYRTNLDLGWEHHIWFDHSYRNLSSFGAVLSSNGNLDQVLGPLRFTEQVSQLGYGGLVLRIRGDF